MCNPIAIAVASFAVNAASAFVQYRAQAQAAAQQTAMHYENRANAYRAFANKNTQINTRIVQEQAAAAEERMKTALEARRARAANANAAASLNVYGNTIEDLMMDITGAEDRAISSINQNLDWTVAQLEFDKRSQAFETVDRINSVPRGQRPNLLALGLGIAGAGLNAGTSYYNMTRRA